MRQLYGSLLIVVTVFALPQRAVSETNSEILDKVWVTGKENACSPEMRSRFDDASLLKLKSLVSNETDRSTLASVLNPFLFSLGLSHTQFFTEKDESYYLFKAHYSAGHPAAPPPPLIINPGVQVGSDDHGYFVREVLDGFPAKSQGLLRGDRILTVGGIPFAGSWGHKAEPKVAVMIERRGAKREYQIELLKLNWAQSFQDATINSINLIKSKGRRIGYVRLWSGLHSKSAEALWRAVKMFNSARVDGVILDLRGGYGGAFWKHLDPFFANRKGYPDFIALDGEDKADVSKADPQENPAAYLGPMVVLVNEGSRSGKELLAYQFKRSNRATVIGTSTPGYFSGGGIFFGDEPMDYLLFLCVMRGQPAGFQIEGHGIRPHVTVEFYRDSKFQDSQLAAGVNYLSGR